MRRRGMMLVLAILLLVALLSCFLYWMGWGQKRSWAEVSGWDGLSPSARSLVTENRESFLSDSAAPTLHWWGHATMEVDWADQRVVIDPVASARIKVAPRRFEDRLLDTSREFDLILLSHAHMDHLDNSTLERLPASRIVLPKGSEDFLSKAVRKKHQVLPMAIGEKLNLGDLELIPVPARHGGWRYPWQRGYTACGFIIRRGERVLYLSGDTAMGPHFEAIAREYHPNYAVLPIGAYAPQWFLQSRHLNPEEAWQAAEVLGVDYLIPYHFGTYRLSLEPMEAPLLRFAHYDATRTAKWLLPDESL